MSNQQQPQTFLQLFQQIGVFVDPSDNPWPFCYPAIYFRIMGTFAQTWLWVTAYTRFFGGSVVDYFWIMFIVPLLLWTVPVVGSIRWSIATVFFYYYLLHEGIIPLDPVLAASLRGEYGSY